jgi:hypothetical protein
LSHLTACWGCWLSMRTWRGHAVERRSLEAAGVPTFDGRHAAYLGSGQRALWGSNGSTADEDSELRRSNLASLGSP